MEQEQAEQKPKHVTFDRSDFISLLALLISLGAFGVSIYEANILKSQQAMMQEQQKASVWPYIEKDNSFVYFDGKAEMSIAFTNKGVGPARIESMNLFINGQAIKDYIALSNLITPLFPNDLELEMELGRIEGILPAGASQRLLLIKSPRFKNDKEILRQLKIQFSLCYCSIYGDCWRITEKDKIPLEGCPDSH